MRASQDGKLHLLTIMRALQQPSYTQFIALRCKAILVFGTGTTVLGVTVC
jgi:hypothetical protein